VNTWVQRHAFRTLVGLLLVIIAGVNGLSDASLGLVRTLNNLIYDTQIRLSAQATADHQIVILDIDERSLGSPKLGRWPWSRDKLATLLDRLFHDYGTKIVAFDVVFAEPDNSSGLSKLRDLAKTSLRGSIDFQQTLTQISKDLDYDQRFANALRGRPVILGYYFNAASGTPTSGELPFPVMLEEDFKGVYADMPTWGGFGSNLSRFVPVAVSSGHFNPIVDSDGLVRRVPLLVKYEKDYYESLALAIARLNDGLKFVGSAGELRLPPIGVAPRASEDDLTNGRFPTLDTVTIGTKRIPTDSSANVLVPYRGGPKTFKYISLVDVLEGREPKESLAGKIAIVGTTAPGLVDLRATPMSGIYPGVEVHANVASALISDDPSAVLKALPADQKLYELLSLLIVGTLLAILMPLLSPVVAATVFGVGIFGLIGAAHLLWQGGTVFPVASLLLTLMALYLWNAGYGYFVESRQKRQFTSLFGQYVPPELVKKMAEDPEKYSMKGRKETLTVLFSDVAGFTSISEQLSPTDLADFINEYLTAMSSIIRDHGGTLDKYIGDAIMAFWGAPIEDPGHAARAVKAALAMQAKVDELNKTFAMRGWPSLRVGIGLSTGPMTVGDMGSQVRRAYTVMGDAVNLGSRLEGLTRMYANGILCGEETYLASAGEFVFREIDLVRVKGKDVPVRIYEPLGEQGTSTVNEMFKPLGDWGVCLNLYRKALWSDAKAILSKLIEENPNDGLYSVYLERVETFEISNPPPGWDGVTNFDTK
jgi:adenylate cyclase